MPDEHGTHDSREAQEASLERILAILTDLGADKIYAKRLAPNDNSKNQPYFGFHLTDLSFLPTGDLVPSSTMSKKTKDAKRQIKYQAPLTLSWFDAEGRTFEAPHAKLIYYPQYPEVRFSGFLQGSRVDISEWMQPQKRGRSEGRWLILGVHPNGTTYAYLAIPDSNLARELENTELVDIGSVLSEIAVDYTLAGASTEEALKAKLLEVYNMGWIPGQKMNADLTTSPYRAQNGGGYTLEAMLGVPPNGYAEPDYLGWEVKKFGVSRFPRTGANPTTLMTPEPDGGIYRDQGAADFVRQYGYPDRSGIPDRLNIGGKHVYGNRIEGTGLTLNILGFDTGEGAITDATGAIALLDDTDTIAASWSFAKLMDHWKRKHSQAVYIPCLRRNGATGGYEYQYGKDIELGTDTDFEMLLSAMAGGNVYYDPGIKLENASTESPRLKRRSQFRVNHRHLTGLYNNFAFVDIAA